MQATTQSDTFAALVNRKLMLPSSKTNYVAVEMNFLSDMMQRYTLQIRVDEDWYLERYPDVVEGIAEGKVKSAADHYARFGFFEHRMPYPIHVDESFYLSQYEDVSTAVQKRTFASGQAHFEEVGYREGRIPYPNFRLAVRELQAA